MGTELVRIDDFKHKQTEIILWNTMAEARYSLNRIGESVFLDAISKVDFKKYPADHEYKIVATEFAEDWGYNKRGNIYRDLKKIAKNLFDTYIEVPHDEFGKVGEYIHIFGRVKYDTGNGCITYVMDREIIPYLDVDTEKGHWFKFIMETRKTLKLKYSFKLYLLMKKNVFYTEMNKRVIYDIDNLKQIIFGFSEKDITEDDKAKSLMEQEFYTFHSRILKPSVDEINNNTELFIEYDAIRDSRSVAKIEFFIKEKKFERISQNNKDTNMNMYEFIFERILDIKKPTKKQYEQIDHWLTVMNPYTVFYFSEKAMHTATSNPLSWLAATLNAITKNYNEDINLIEYIENSESELTYLASQKKDEDQYLSSDEYVKDYLIHSFGNMIEEDVKQPKIIYQFQ